MPSSNEPTGPAPTWSGADPDATTGGDYGPPAGPSTAAAGRYELGDEIARGGMGDVYRAADTTLNREVAVKVLQERFAASSGAARRFAAEARITGRLQHPNIPAVHDLGTLPDGRPFLAMKLIRGDTLADLLEARPDPSAERGRFVAAFEGVCQAVAFAHAQGVIHRDLKPANVMVGSFGEVQVMDWGLAKDLASRTGPGPGYGPDHPPVDTGGSPGATAAGAVLGTPAYMPPEQAAGAVDRVDARSDVFGLGGILAAVLTGRPPFTGATGEGTRQMSAGKKVQECFARLDASGADPELVALCKRCLAPEQEDRPADAGEVARAVAGLRAAADDRARQAELDRVEAAVREAELRKRRRVQLALAGVVGLLLLGGGAAGWWQERQAGDRRERLARNAEAVAGLLDRTEAALRANGAAKADLALAAAEKRAGEGGTDDLAPRLTQLRTDLALLRDLDGVDRFRWTPSDNSLPDQRVVAGQFREVLARFGMNPEATPADELARRAVGSAVRNRLVAALDRVLVVEKSPGVRSLLRVVDPHPFRDAVRDAVLAGDNPAFVRLAAQPGAVDQPPEFIAMLGEHTAIPVGTRRELLTAAGRRRPNDLGLVMNLGSTYPIAQRGSADERVRWYQAAVGIAPGSPVTHNNLGHALHDREDVGGAMAAFREAIRLGPEYALAHYNLGTALVSKGDLDGAATCYREAIRLDPNYSRAHNNLGNVLYDRGDLDGAVTCCREAIRLDPQNAPAHAGLGNALRAKGDVDGAIACYREAIRLDPKYARAHNNLGLALRGKVDLEEEVACYREAIRLDPKYAAPHYNLGAALLSTGDVPGAVLALEEASRLDPKHPQIKLLLAQVRKLKAEQDAKREVAPPRPKGP